MLKQSTLHCTNWVPVQWPECQEFRYGVCTGRVSIRSAAVRYNTKLATLQSILSDQKHEHFSAWCSNVLETQHFKFSFLWNIELHRSLYT